MNVEARFLFYAISKEVTCLILLIWKSVLFSFLFAKYLQMKTLTDSHLFC